MSFDIFDETYATYADPRGVVSITSTGLWSGASLLISLGVGAAAWPATNRAIFVPVVIPFPVVAERIVIGCGATAGGNFDVGIYNSTGTRLVNSGSTARVASSEVICNITDTYLRAGLYFLAMSADSTNTYVVKSPTQLAYTKLAGVRTMETAFTLPTTATFATAASAPIPAINMLVRPAFSQPSLFPPVNPPLVITPYHPESTGLETISVQSLSANAASRIPGANVVNYVPFRLNQHATVRKMSLLVGGANTGNVQVGLYTAVGSRIVSSGTVALGTINTLQECDITDTLLAPGTYFMAVTLENAAGTWFGLSQTDENILSNWPVYQETTGGFGLPATAGMALSTSATVLCSPVMGVHFNTLI